MCLTPHQSWPHSSFCSTTTTEGPPHWVGGADSAACVQYWSHDLICSIMSQCMHCGAVSVTVQPVSLLFLCPSSPDSTQRALSTGGTGGGEVVGWVGPVVLAGSARD